jgi:DNA-binding GntR family transcriptional regulator
VSKAAEKAYVAIRSKILSGEFPSGTHLKEEDLSLVIGVSRTPIREALRNLAAEYFVKFVPNHGAYVASWSNNDIEQVFDLRKLLEGYAAGRAALRISEEDIARLEASVQEVEQAIRDPKTQMAKKTLTEEDRAFFQAANSVYHKILIGAAGSERLSVMVGWLSEAPIILKTVNIYTPADFLRSNQHHIELIAACRARNEAWATSIMQSHLLAAKEVFMAARKQEDNPVARKAKPAVKNKA